MYQDKKIITAPNSNNRLNWDERINHTIVVPSLIEGTLNDVIIGEETAIESEVDWKIIAGKWLKNFVFLNNSRVPTWIMDNHNHAFAFWHEALAKGFIQPWSLLVHIDQHTDLATPASLPMKEMEVEEYTNTVLTIADFIVPALATWLISEAVMVTGEERDGAGVFIWEDEKLVKKTHKLSTPYLLSSTSIIVDLDLDYFSQGFDEETCLENVQYWLEKADIVTIATSPLFIDQEKALAVLKSLQKSLVAL
jgi:hypothetical protein